METGEICSSSGGQSSSLKLHCEPRRHQKQKPPTKGKIPLGIPHTEGHNFDSGVASHSAELRGRCPIKERGRQLRVEAKSTSLPHDMSNNGKSNSGSICLKDIPSTKILYVIQNGSKCPSNRCIPTRLVKHDTICIPPLLANREGPSETEEAQNRHDNNNSCVDSTTLVSSPSQNVHSNPSIVAKKPKPTLKPKGRNPPPFTTGPRSSVGCMEDFKQQLQAEHISEEAIELISKCRREGTRSNYNSAWSQFTSWNKRRGTDPIRCPLNIVLDYLTFLFKKGRSYRNINVHRSAISAFHERIQNFPVGKHPRVCQLLKGVGNERVPQPKHIAVWDVSLVLNYLDTKPSNDLLSIKDLSLKLVILLALTSLHRGSELHMLDLGLMSIFNDRIEFTFNKPLKHSKPGKTDPPSIFYEFPANSKLCPKHCLQSYLENTHPWRDSPSGPMFLSFINPHNPVTKQSLTRWVKEILSQAGIIGFSAHSTRGAASSKAVTKGVAVKDILAKGNWTNRSTFEKFYNRATVTPTQRFQKALLNPL